jgi:hypothetical protein
MVVLIGAYIVVTDFTTTTIGGDIIASSTHITTDLAGTT